MLMELKYQKRKENLKWKLNQRDLCACAFFNFNLFEYEQISIQKYTATRIEYAYTAKIV